MRVSAIIPTYNRERTVARTVESALAQTYSDMEVVVVDDGSRDGTLDVLGGFGDQIRVVSQENAGPSAARNRGAREARGEVLAFLDSDDLWMPEKIERQMGVLQRAGEGVCCCVCNAELDSSSGERTTSFQAAGIEGGPDEGILENPAKIFSTRFMLFNQVVAVRKQIFEKVGGFEESLWLLEDHHLALKLAAQGAWGYVAAPLVKKYEEPDGLGDAGRKDEIGHLSTVVKVLTLILEQESGLSGEFRRDLIEERERLRRAVGAHLQVKSGALVGASVGRLRLLVQRLTNALRRRSPAWPVAELSPF